jgi:hypothetical protein
MNATASSGTSAARELVDRLSSRLANEKRELVLFLIELAEFDATKLALELGYPSTLGCLVGELGLTETSACRRIAAARLLARFPQITPLLLASKLTLTGLVALKDLLDDSNVDAVLERAAGLSETGVRELVMRMRLADATPSPPLEGPPAQPQVATAVAAGAAADRVATPSETESPPLEELEAVTLWVGPEFRAELAAVRTLLSHAVPSGKKEDVLLHVLRAQRKRLERGRYGSAKQKIALAVTKNTSASIPAAVRRQVFDRDGGCCTYVGEEGRRCASTLRLEYQHIVPVARGGRSTPENLTLFCRAHNQLQAEKDFGVEHIMRKRAESALTKLGYSRKDAERALGIAMAQLAPSPDLDTLLRACLRLLT